MAERRMFAKTIIDSDAFIDMPVTARLLYYDLSMRADDDGFVNSPKKIMRMIGASQDDMAMLIMKKFIIPFDNGIVVIKHWRIHNYIRKDMYHETKYKEQKELLALDENNAYTLNYDNTVTNPLQVRDEVVTSTSTQDRLGKDSIGKDSIEKTQMISQADRERAKPHQFDDEFAYVWSLYPKKQGKQNAFKSYVKARKAGTSQQEIIDGINAYLNYINVERVEERFIKQGSTWFNQNCWKDDYTVHREPTTKDLAGQFDYSDW